MTARSRMLAWFVAGAILWGGIDLLQVATSTGGQRLGSLTAVVLGLYADESCRVQLDDTGIREAIGEVFFKPALVKGKPVEGIAYVRLSEI